MDDFRIVVPQDVVRRLRAQKISDAKIRRAVMTTLEELAKPTRPKPRSGETAVEYFRRIILDMSGGKPPALDEAFLKNGMTRGEYLALGEEEEKALWDKWHEEEWSTIEKKYGEGVDVRLKGSPRQKRRAKDSKGTREKRSNYRTQARRTKRA
ncbi:MAG TPA: hypothetical protein VFD70_24645 [Anaerolineae bacterium]|nr:hypothetical protein [Anaerolineae bacterium]